MPKAVSGLQSKHLHNFTMAHGHFTIVLSWKNEHICCHRSLVDSVNQSMVLGGDSLASPSNGIWFPFSAYVINGLFLKQGFRRVWKTRKMRIVREKSQDVSFPQKSRKFVSEFEWELCERICPISLSALCKLPNSFTNYRQTDILRFRMWNWTVIVLLCFFYSSKGPHTSSLMMAHWSEMWRWCKFSAPNLLDWNDVHKCVTVLWAVL